MFDELKYGNDIVVTKEWSNFIEKGNVPKSVSNIVICSWERSKELGIDPYEGKSHIILSSKNLKEKLDKNRLIIDAAKPFMKQMHYNIKLNGYIGFLTDGEGNILYIDGDENVMDSFGSNLNFFTGASWSEDAVGTTAVSLAISTKKSIPFVSQEKYCYKLKTKACTAVPIIDYDEQIIAILGIAANFPNPNPNIYSILVYTKLMIESFLKMQILDRELKLIDSCNKKMLLSVSDPIVMLDGNGTIMNLNSKAKEILGKKNINIKESNIINVLGFNPMQTNTLKTSEGKSLYFKKTVPVYDFNNDMKLAICFLEPKEINRHKTICNRISETKFCFDNIIGSSDVMEKIKKKSIIAAKSNFNVLIEGKSGTGKELFAQAIHDESDRKHCPFIALNCGAIPENLIESELFGYENGAFTGAIKEGKPGKFELANGGTIFLDEIGDMHISLQTRLLRVLQEKEITRLGGYSSMPIDVRVIAATNKNLMEEVNKGNFREDLFWRINVIPIYIPSLKDRNNDFIELLEYFNYKYDKEKIKKLEYHPDVIKIFKEYNWPGNVRELENIVKRLLVFVDGNIVTCEDLPEYMTVKIKKADYGTDVSLDQIQKEVIERTLKENDNNVSETARKLGISRNTIYNKLGVEKFSKC